MSNSASGDKYNIIMLVLSLSVCNTDIAAETVHKLMQTILYQLNHGQKFIVSSSMPSASVSVWSIDETVV